MKGIYDNVLLVDLKLIWERVFKKRKSKKRFWGGGLQDFFWAGGGDKNTKNFSWGMEGVTYSYWTFLFGSGELDWRRRRGKGHIYSIWQDQNIVLFI